MNPITALLQAMGFGVDQGTAIAQAMRGENPNARMQSGPILNEDGTFVGAAGTDLRRGMDDPRVGMGNRTVPMPPPRPALSPLTPVADVNAGRVAVAPGPILAGAMQPDTSPDNQDIAGGDRTPMMAPVSDRAPDTINPPQRGFFDKFFNNQDQYGNSPFMYAMRGLGAAGSQDPMKTMMQFAAQDTENEKIRQARRKANQPKIDQVPGTPYFMVTNPADGSVKFVKNDEIGKYLSDSTDAKVNAGVQRILLQGAVTQANQQAQVDNKTATEARPMLNDVQSLKGRWGQAMEIVSGQGTGAQLQAIPGIAGIAGFFGGDEVAKNKFLQGLTVDETLLNTAKTKGAISNTEMALFKSPIPALTDDREKVWKPWIEQRVKVLEKMEKFYASEAARDAAPGSNLPQSPRAQGGAAPQASPPPSDQLRAAVTAAGIAFEPDKFDYRIGPGGQVQRKAK